MAISSRRLLELIRYSTAYHLEKMVKCEDYPKLEDLLRACGYDFGKGWDRTLPLIEFSYNNSYSIQVLWLHLLRRLYGRKCRSPICWAWKVGADVNLLDQKLFVETTEKIIPKSCIVYKFTITPWKGVCNTVSANGRKLNLVTLDLLKSRQGGNGGILD
ncbi:putative reverse transcriptase domain-containing protein [Tanacetum coccineum]